jgi:hypothetical protein
MNDTLCRSDAAYVLGALSPGERREFEIHLAGCPDCQQSVRQLAGVPGLLAKVSVADLDDQPPVPATLLPRLVTDVRRTRFRRRFASIGLAAAAAAVVLVLVLFNHGPGAPQQVAMHSLRPGPVHATVALVDKEWGTQVDLRCSYEETKEWQVRGEAYRLVVTNVKGETAQIGTWKVVPDKVATIVGAVNWPSAAIKDVKVEAQDGTPVLGYSP